MFVLFKGSMKHQFAGSLAAAVLLSGAGLPFTGAQPLSTASQAKVTESVAADLSASLPEGESPSPELRLADGAIAANQSTTLPEPEGISFTTDLIPSLDGDILIHPHAIDGKQAATLYVRDIPVLTFIGTEVDSLANNSDAVSLAAGDSSLSLQSGQAAPTGAGLDAERENDPVLRATALGRQLGSEAVEATDISVRWNKETEGYIVTLAGSDLISLDSRTILADTTENPAEDALQVTNRLRRLLGGAEPVSEIEGRPKPEPAPAPPAQTVAIVSSNVGRASWYGPGFNGRRSASGEIFNQNALTAAHRTLPFGTRVLVTNLNNGRQVTVRINDRGPYSGGRIIDLSAGAASQIGLINSGVGRVQLDVLAN